MISEVVNALCVTFFATEHLSAADDRNGGPSLVSVVPLPRKLALLAIVAVINVLDRVTGAADLANDAVRGFLHLPKILFAALLYVLALYVDCRRHCTDVAKFSLRKFLPAVFSAFCRILPLYPFLAVLISFVFLFVINLWEFLNLPNEWLNWPIYYGTLYGPFSLVYWRVKRQILDQRNHLPTTMEQQGGRILGDG